ncbi:hypothetical protein [Providencia sp. PROV255]|uniref:hypothetical protein n=1 Tax=Providencia sp. PROV255 TaxID=2949943 RepID=UPI002348FA2D|nr:hypothetical protein [Providencia sp. PROV255]
MMRALSLALLFCFTLPALAQSPSPTLASEKPKLRLNEQNEQIARKTVFDFLATKMILVSEGTVSGDAVTYEAMVGDQRCTVVLELNKTPIELWRVKDLNCKN